MKNLHRRLDSELAVCQIIPDGKGRLLRVPHNVTVHDLVLEVQSAINELIILKTNIGESRITDRAIKIEIRNQRANELLHCLSTYLMRQLI